VSAETCTDADILQVYQEQNTTVEPGFRWIKNPAAISPVWLEKPEQIAALAMLTVLSLLVYSIIQRQVHLYLRMHDQQLPGNKGLTATPTAVVLALFTQVALVQLWIDDQEVTQLSGVQPHHLLVCDALGLDPSWYAVPSAQKHSRGIQKGCISLIAACFSLYARLKPPLARQFSRRPVSRCLAPSVGASTARRGVGEASGSAGGQQSGRALSVEKAI
jgi:hypothetical protein